MTDANATQFLSRPVWRDPRVHLLDDLWLLTIFAVLFATAVPWLASGKPDKLAMKEGVIAEEARNT